MCIEASFVRIFARLLESSECICTLEYGRHEHWILFGVQRHQQHGDRTHPRSVPLHYLFWQPERETTNPLDHVVNGRNFRYRLAVVSRPEFTQRVRSISRAQPFQDTRELQKTAEVLEVRIWFYRDRHLLGQQLVAIACELLCGLAFVVQFPPPRCLGIRGSALRARSNHPICLSPTCPDLTTGHGAIGNGDVTARPVPGFETRALA